MQKHVNLVDLVKSFPTNIFLQNLASIQKRTSPIKFVHLAKESEKGSISNLSTKQLTRCSAGFSRRQLTPLECTVPTWTEKSASDAHTLPLESSVESQKQTLKVPPLVKEKLLKRSILLQE